MSKAKLRIAYSTLITLVFVPFFLGVLVNDLPASFRHLWPYFLGALVLTTASAISLELRERRDKPAVAGLGRVADQLARSISKQWLGEAEAHRVDEPSGLRISWQIIAVLPSDSSQEVGAAVPPPREEAEKAGVSGRSDSAWDTSGLDRLLLTQIPTRRLIVLGGPGSGKTMLLVKLVLRLLDDRDAHLPWIERGEMDQVVPVILPLAAWNPEQDLPDWIEDRLIAEHPSLQAPEHPEDRPSPSLASALIRENLILPVLDGFDEIPGTKQVAAIRKIATALRGSMKGTRGLIMSSRREEFREAADKASTETMVVPGATAVGLDDVSADAASDYLNRTKSGRWAPVLEQLGTASPAGEVLRTPLMLSLAHAVYNVRPRGREDMPLPEPAKLLDCQSVEDLRDHLLDEFVSAAYRDSPHKIAPTAQALRYLAAYLEQGGQEPRKRDPVNQEPTEPPASRESVSFAWWQLRDALTFPLVGLVIGIPAGIAVGIVAAVVPRLGVGLGLGMITGTSVCLIAGMIANWNWRIPGAPPAIGVGIACGFIGALAGAAPTGLILHLTGLASSPVQGLMGALGAGIGPGVLGGFRRGTPAAAAGGIVAALTAGTATGLPAGVIDGAGAWLTIALVLAAAGLREPSRGVRRMHWSRAGYLVGMTAGLACGTAVAVTTGPLAGLITGTVSAVIGGFAAGLEGIPAEFTLAEATATPDELLGRDRGTFLVVAVAGGTAFGLGAGLAVHPAVGLAGGLAVGLTAATLQASWLPFVVSRWWFAMASPLPLRLMSFLDDAYQHEILRVVGGVYQFRHIQLQRYLAKQYAATSLARQRSTPELALLRARR